MHTPIVYHEVNLIRKCTRSVVWGRGGGGGVQKGEIRQGHTEDLVTLLYTGHTQNQSGCVNIATMLVWVFRSRGKGGEEVLNIPIQTGRGCLSHLFEVKKVVLVPCIVFSLKKGPQ